MLDFETNIDEKELKKYKKKNIYGPIIMLILVLCVLGYILFGPDGVLSYLPRNVGNIVTDKKIEEMKKKIEEEKEKEIEKENKSEKTNENKNENIKESEKN